MRIGAVSPPPPFAPCLLLRSHHRPNLRRYDADGGGYVLASLRRGYDASAFDASDRVVSVDVPARCIDTTSSSSSSSSWIRKLLLTTKAPSVAAASSSVLHLLHPTEPVDVVVMTNGALAVTEELRSVVGGRNVGFVQATTTHGAHRGGAEMSEEEYGVVHAGMGRTFLRNTPFDPAFVSDLARLWDAAGLRTPVVSEEEMAVLQWKKLAVNCAVNPITALRGCANGGLAGYFDAGSVDCSGGGGGKLCLEDPTLLHGVIKEVSAVAVASLASSASPLPPPRQT